jgi:hypothetical protein
MQVNGGVIQHLANDDAELYRLRVSVGGDFTLGASASMVVDTQGYTEREGPGNCGHWAGGVHGGLVDGNCASVYGSLFAPVNLGSGGYTCSGGGAIYITVLGQSTVDGLLSANGGTHEDSAPGGSVFLTTGSIVGNGTLQANGGNHSSWSRHGSGGRVAVVLTAPGSDFASWSGQVTAYGGTGNSSHAYGSAGTVYLETAAQSGGAGTLIIDNNNNAPFGVVKTPIDSSIDLYAFSEVIVRNKGDLEILDGATLDFGDLSHFTFDADGPDESFITVSDPTNVVFPDPFTISGYTLNLDGVSSVTGDWTVASDGVLAHTSNWTDSIDKLQLTVNGNLRVQAGGRVGRVGLGYRGREGIGACGFAGQWNGASHGGRGGNPRPDVAPVYGDLFAPVDPGSGGCGGKITGGGVLRLTVTGVTQLDGTIAADGTGYAGGAAGGSVYLTTASLQGSGKISANGGSAIEEGWSQGGGGGRVAVYLSTPGAVFSSFSGTISAYGGPSPNSDVSGAAGTVYLETADQSAGTGVLILDNNGRMPRSIAKTPIDSSVDLSAFSQVIIRNQADLELIDGAALDFGSLGNFVFDPDGADESFITITDPTSVTIPTNFTIDGYTLRLDGITSVTGNWTIGANGGLSHTANGGNSAYSFDLTVDGSFSVEAGGVVGGTGCGYRFNQGPSPGD